MNINRVSHGELETCRRQPGAWAQEKISAAQVFRKIGYNQTLLGGIYRFHKSQSAVEARQHLQVLLRARDFKDYSRVAQLEDDLDSYIEWFLGSDSASADHRVRLGYKQGFLELRGEVSRVDVLVSGGYRAVLLCDPNPQWKRQLRMPLIQLGIASKYGIPAEEVAVGVQQFSGEGLDTVRFTNRRLQSAIAEFKRLGNVVRRFGP